MPWTELHINTTANVAQEISDYLTESGAQAVTLLDAGDQPIYEPDPGHSFLWPETNIVGLFEQDTLFGPIILYLSQQKTAGLIKEFYLTELADQPWERVCLEGFKPMAFGKRLWICPSWLLPIDPNAVNIILDPGLAFGTGSHPTTALCLEWLDEHLVGGENVIDYGCGSGILAIAALKLGAKHVFAIDHDPQALLATKDNAQRNQVSALSTYLPSEIHNLSALFSCNLILANILFTPLITLAPVFAKYTQSTQANNITSKIVLSGILAEQVDDIKKAYAPWFDLNETRYLDQWACVSGVRRN